MIKERFPHDLRSAQTWPGAFQEALPRIFTRGLDKYPGKEFASFLPLLRICRSTRPWLVLLLVGALFLNVQPVHAHGGVIVAGDLTEKYEWIIQVNPYPVTTPGETFVSLVVYDIKTYQPIDGLSVQAYLAPPGSTELCCQPGRDLGPMEILHDPVQYPGDYSILHNFTPIGQWSGIFLIENVDGGEPLKAPFSFLVLPQDFTQFESPLEAPTATFASPLAPEAPNAAAQSVAISAVTPATETESSALGIETLPAPRGLLSLSTSNLMLLGGAALVPVVLLVVWFLRSPNSGDDAEEGDAHD